MCDPNPVPAPVPQSNPRWFDENVQPHAVPLRAFLRRRFPLLTEVDDVVQEALLKTLLAARKGKLVSIKGYLFTVAVNTTVSLFRRRKYISPTPVNELPALCVVEEVVDVVESVCARDELLIMAEAIAQLPDRCRRVVTLRAVHGREYAEIARELGLSESTVRVQLARGMAKCSRYLRERGILDSTRRRDNSRQSDAP